ncbi:hypothetical protein SUGI_0202660 [Cryptomeria japonica]|nr:hypothetical protein SUGI_0202660 [Cryptomeria japonica]
MDSSGDSNFRQLYLQRLVGALNALNRPGIRAPGNEDEVAGSSRNIKLAADVSLALTANRTAWSRALLNRISSDERSRPALRKILGPKHFQALIIAQRARKRSRLKLQSKMKQASRGQRSEDGLSLYRCFCSKRLDPATSSEASLVKKRKRKLQSLVPGGTSMDTFSLLDETAHYITSLTTQWNSSLQLLSCSWRFL